MIFWSGFCSCVAALQTTLGSCDVPPLCIHRYTTKIHDNIVHPGEPSPDLVHGAQGWLLNEGSYLSFAIKTNIETETCRRQKDVLKARLVKASLG